MEGSQKLSSVFVEVLDGVPVQTWRLATVQTEVRLDDRTAQKLVFALQGNIRGIGKERVCVCVWGEERRGERERGGGGEEKKKV